MGLATAIVLMVNHYGLRRGLKTVLPSREAPVTKELEKERSHAGRDRDDERQRNERAEKTEKTDRPEKIGAPARTDPEPAKKQEPTPEEKSVRIYLVKLNEESDKMYLAPVGRKVTGGSVLENTMKELIKGPTATEKKKGMLTAVPSTLRVNGVKIRGNVAEIDFNGAIEQGAAGSILLNRIDQIVYTATQFPNVGSVVITINGKQRQTLGTDGLSIGGPLHRRN